jgi:shikimate kinase
MGVGKSTIGKHLATLLHREFQDTDHVIEAKCGCDIPWIFDVEGEEGFRQRESAVLEELLAQPGLVIATGGGIVMREANRNLLKARGDTVFLTASVSQLVKRTYKDRKRPLLQVDDPKAKIEQLLALREPLYKGVADFSVSTDRKSPKAVAEAIVNLLQN